MGAIEQPKSPFPAEFKYLETELANVEKALADMDAQIEAMPNDAGPRLRFQPPGSPPIIGVRNQQKSQLQQRRDELKSSYQTYSKNELNKADLKTAGKLNDFIDHRLSDNQFKNFSPEELKQQKSQVKQQSKSFDPGGKSFDYMEALYFKQQTAIDTKPTDQNIEPNQNSITNNPINYSGGTDDIKPKEPDPTIEPVAEPEIDTEPDKD